MVRSARSEHKFFPGYVLVEMEMNDDTWHIVKNVQGSGFYRWYTRKTSTNSQREADAILARGT